MENIPAAFYFSTDAEANWKKTAPKKYHKVRFLGPMLAFFLSYIISNCLSRYSSVV